MAKKYRLTALFLAVSLIVTAGTLMILNRISAEVGERSLINISTKMAETDAELIGGALETMAEARIRHGDTEMTVTDIIRVMNAGDPLGVLMSFIGPDVLEPLNLVGMSTIAADGTMTNNIGTHPGIDMAHDGDAQKKFERTVAGEPVSVLTRDFQYEDPDGGLFLGDVVTSYVAVANSDGSADILMISRDMSGRLDAEIAVVRSGMFKVTFAALGGMFVLLLGFVIAFDVRIWKDNQRFIAEQIRHSELERDKVELKRLNETKDRFISTVSHELKTPLATMMGYAEIMGRNRGDNLTGTQLEQLQTMRKAGWRLDRLIDDMLDISRIESGRLELQRETIVVRDIAKELRDSLKPVVAARRQRLVVSQTGPQVAVVADRARIMQCISNLITNAAKYSADGSLIRVNFNSDAQRLYVSVEDQGFGIPEGDQTRLFDLFFRSDNEQTRSQPGMGLGLFVTNAIVQGHGGKLDISSEVGVGTVATIELPGARLVGAEAAEQAREEERAPRLTMSRLQALHQGGAGS